MRVFDCFTFFEELDILDIRLHEMDRFVDYFVIVESTETFSGIKKPLYFEENKERFKEFLPKIIHRVAPLTSGKLEAWERQEFQRNYVAETLEHYCEDDDLVLVSDVDEIIGVDPVKKQGDRKNPTSYVHQHYIFYMNLRKPGAWPGLVALPFGTLKGTHNFGNFVADYYLNLWEVRRLRRKGNKVNNGWHFANMGGKEQVIRKVQASCHHKTEKYKKMASDPDFLYDMMEGDRKVKADKVLSIVPIDDKYPKWFRENLDRFEHLLTKEDVDDKDKGISEIERDEEEGLQRKSEVG
jgi:beta-1,4-mannosyl-glycoprotein beta-1,4-N-acetylglucosaminyltransferase